MKNMTREERVAHTLQRGAEQRIARDNGTIPKRPKPPRVETVGVGDALIAIISHRFHVPPCQRCHETAAKMNDKGAEWCREHADELAEELRGNADSRKWTAVLAWAAESVGVLRYRELVIEACEAIEPPKRNNAECVSDAVGEITKRNLLMHVMPSGDPGIWQNAVESVRLHIDLFNGKRVVAIATDDKSASSSVVRQWLEGCGCTFAEYKNNATLREVVSLLDMLAEVESDDPHEATFYCHSKGVTRPLESTAHRWREVMYETCLNWDAVQESLTTKPLTGTFKKMGAGFTGSTSDWHYSGTFWWFRNRDLFQRKWQKVDLKWWGAESYPSLVFAPEEAGCLLKEGTVRKFDLYNQDYWSSVIEPAFEGWKRGRTAE